MRIENKYIRNRRFRKNAWKHYRSRHNPYAQTESSWHWTHEDRVKMNLESIEKSVRALDSGTHKHWNHASASFRRELNKQRKAKERNAVARIRNGNLEHEVPTFKRDADWLYF